MNYFTPSYWFNLRPEALLPIFQKIFIALTIILVIAAIFSNFKKKQKGAYRQVWLELHNFFTTNAVIALFLLFFNYERVRLFSSRFWFLLWGILIIVWLYFIIKKIKEIPARKEQLAQEREYKKYLP